MNYRDLAIWIVLVALAVSALAPVGRWALARLHAEDGGGPRALERARLADEAARAFKTALQFAVLAAIMGAAGLIPLAVRMEPFTKELVAVVHAVGWGIYAGATAAAFLALRAVSVAVAILRRRAAMRGSGE